MNGKYLSAVVQYFSAGLKSGTVAASLTAAAFLLLGSPSASFANGEQGDDNPTGVSGVHNGNSTTAGNFDAFTGNAVREIDDIVVPGSLGAYPLKWTRYFNSHCTYADSSRGGAWLFAYSYGYEFNSRNYVDFPDGRHLDFTHGQPFGVPEYVDNPYVNGGYPHATLHLADGGQVKFDATDQLGHYRLSEIIDPYGLVTTIGPVAGGTQITEPGGRYLLVGPIVNGSNTVQAFDGVSATPIQSVTYTWASQTFTNGTYTVLTRADYSDGTFATYTYSEQSYRGPPICGYPYIPGGIPQHIALLKTCDDVRYDGPMRQLAYVYQSGTANDTRLTSENRLVNGQPGEVVSSVTGDTGFGDTATETRGDGPSRTFHYHPGCKPPDCPPPDTEPCPDPQPLDGKMTDYSDFQGHYTYLTYETSGAAAGYIKQVQDVNGHTTAYTHSPLSWGITQITYPATASEPNGSFITQTFWPDESHPWFLASRTNERYNSSSHDGFKVEYTRNAIDAPHNPNAITRKDYKDYSGNLLEYETFDYNNFGQVISHRMRNGAFEYWLYDSRGLLLTKTNPTWTDYTSAYNNSSYPSGFPSSEPATSYTYYSNADVPAWTDRVKTETDARNYHTTYSYDYALDANGQNTWTSSGTPKAGRGLVTRIAYPDDTHDNTIQGGTAKTFCFDKWGNKLWEKNEKNEQTTWVYDEYKRVLSVTDGVGNQTTYSYLPWNKTSSYITTSKLPFVTTTPEGWTSNKTTNTYYDADWHKTRTQEAPGTGEANTYFGYDYLGNQTSVTDPRGSSAGDPNYTTTTTYDQRDRKYQVTDPQAHVTTFAYDPASNITGITRPDGYTETKQYDALNRVTLDQIPKDVGPPVVYIQNYFHYYSPATAQMCGQLKDFVNGEGYTTTFTYDPAGMKLSVIYPISSDHQDWTYDNNHNVIGRKTVNGVTQNFTYDERNRKRTMTWTNSADYANFKYDAAGRLTNADNGNATILRDYTAAGELMFDKQTISGLSLKDVEYVYSRAKQSRAYLVGATYDYTFGYDAMGRFEKITPTGGSVSFQYYYDAASNETERYSYPSTTAQFYSRDNLSRMTERDVKFNNTSIISTEAYGYDSMSRLASVDREDGKRDAFAYQLNSEIKTASYGQPTPTPTASPTPTPPTQCLPVSFSTTGGGTTTLKVFMSTGTAGATIFYTVGNHYVTPTHSGGTATGTTHIYTGSVNVARGTEKFFQAVAYKSGMTDSTFSEFDADNTGGGGGFSVIRPGSGGPSTITYGFDKAGNRNTVTDGVTTDTYTRTALNQYSNVNTNGVNAVVSNGTEHEISAYQSANYTYINDERLTQVTLGTNTYQLKYDALGRCVKRTFNNVITYYVYDGEKPIAEYNSSGTLTGRNLYGKGIDEILMRIDATYGTYYYQDDHEGSVTHVLASDGSIKESYKYDVFGSPIIEDANGNLQAASTINNRFMFTGREYAATFGIYEYRARAYHPALGRFMSEDPRLFVHGNRPLGRTHLTEDMYAEEPGEKNWTFDKDPDEGELNLFRYCGDDPVDFTDATGEDVYNSSAITIFVAVEDESAWRTVPPGGIVKGDTNAISRGRRPDGHARAFKITDPFDATVTSTKRDNGHLKWHIKLKYVGDHNSKNKGDWKREAIAKNSYLASVAQAIRGGWVDPKVFHLEKALPPKPPDADKLQTK